MQKSLIPFPCSAYYQTRRKHSITGMQSTQFYKCMQLLQQFRRRFRITETCALLIGPLKRKVAEHLLHTLIVHAVLEVRQAVICQPIKLTPVLAELAARLFGTHIAECEVRVRLLCVQPVCPLIAEPFAARVALEPRWHDTEQLGERIETKKAKCFSRNSCACIPEPRTTWQRAHRLQVASQIAYNMSAGNQDAHEASLAHISLS